MNANWTNEDTYQSVESVSFGLDNELDTIARESFPGETGWIPNDTKTTDFESIDLAHALVSQLDGPEYELFRIRLSLQWNLEQIATELGITLHEAKALEARGIEHMKRVASDVIRLRYYAEM